MRTRLATALLAGRHVCAYARLTRPTAPHRPVAALRAIQKETLGVVVDEPEEAAGGGSDGAGSAAGDDADDPLFGSTAEVVGKIPDGPSIEWHTTLLGVPADESRPLIAVAQELFDALPIHQFEKADR